MRRSEWEDRCKRHPEHRQSKGVCPYCLRDRLRHLSASSSATTTTRASTSATTSPSYSSGGASSPPPHHVALSADVSSVHVFGGEASEGSSFVNVAAFSQPLMPTTTAVHSKKQPATITRRQELDATELGKGEAPVKNKKKGGKRAKKIGRFLSRLVGAEKRRQTGNDGELFHSKTMKDKTASKWVFF